jgi:predicted 3-demethylubiquinone-9 3-methyltransferase (glyoxalase superfamily)
LSWQVVPRRLLELLSDPQSGSGQRATAAMLGMRKIDIAAVERAARGT